jgi:hydroxymethylpyrimidine pyrophosphatase-like HAD family hydrolase
MRPMRLSLVRVTVVSSGWLAAMRFTALAVDYDGTLARNGRVDEPTLLALERWRDSGRKLILVTGRELDELEQVFGRLDVFDRVVAENGALLLAPASRELRPLAAAPPPAFVEALRQRGVTPLFVGRVVVATWQPQEAAVAQVIRELGLPLEVIRNKRAVMVLPAGIDKATGLRAALAELKIPPGDTVGVGDAENDQPLLNACGYAAAVANALPAVKRRVDYVATRDHGGGVAEVIDKLLK